MLFRKKEKKKPDNLLGKVWYFIWDDDSVLSWIVNIIIAFLVIKFVIYPGLGFVLGTTHPVVAVVSGSMEHSLSAGVICGHRPESYRPDLDGFWEICGSFYDQYGISRDDFQRFPFRNGFNTGDIIVLWGRNPEKISIGDVIVFQADKPDPIIHRVINKWKENGKYYFSTKGDHNPSMLYFESDIVEDRVIGKAQLRIPWLGHIKIWFVELLRLLNLDKSIGRLF